MVEPNKSFPHPMDVALGARIRQLREKAGLSQHEIGLEIGITGQQFSNYELGRDRIFTSRLFEIAGRLGVTVCEIIAPLEEAGRRSAG